MAVKAYVLIEARIGKTKEVIEAIRRLPRVASIDAVTGPYDAIALVRTKTLEEIEDMIVAMVQPLADISRIVTCIAV